MRGLGGSRRGTSPTRENPIVDDQPATNLIQLEKVGRPLVIYQTVFVHYVRPRADPPKERQRWRLLLTGPVPPEPRRRRVGIPRPWTCRGIGGQRKEGCRWGIQCPKGSSIMPIEGLHSPLQDVGRNGVPTWRVRRAVRLGRSRRPRTDDQRKKQKQSRLHQLLHVRSGRGLARWMVCLSVVARDRHRTPSAA
jgi:hypothetical protein